MSIPKIIHYVWVGKAPKSELIQRCIASWKQFLPGYEIVEWNEDNYDIHKNPYIDKAYSQKKWAFVADYIRFDILYEYGGIYFDTDVELLKTIPNNILEQHAFSGFESMGYVNPGLVFACEPGNVIVKEVLVSFIDDVFDDRENLYTINERMSDILDKHGLVRNNTCQKIAGISIYPSEYFCAYNQILREPDITENTVSVHHYAATWRSGRIRFKMKVRELLKRMLGRERFNKLITIKRKIV